MIGASQTSYGQLAPYGTDYGIVPIVVAAIIGGVATVAGGGLSLFGQHKAQSDTLAGVEKRIVKLQRKYAKAKSAKKRERLAGQIRELEAQAEALRAGLQQIEATAAASPADATSLPPASQGASSPGSNLGVPVLLAGLFVLGAAGLWFLISAPATRSSRRRKAA